MQHKILRKSSALFMALLFFLATAAGQKVAEKAIQPRFMHVATISVLSGITTSDMVSSNVGFSFSNLMKINKVLNGGIGFGFDFFGMQFGTQTLTPFFGEFRLDLPSKSELNLMASVQGGYAFPMLDNRPEVKTTGGAMLSATAGILAHINDRAAINIGAGYRFQAATEQSLITNAWQPEETIITRHQFSRFQIGIGVVFR